MARRLTRTGQDANGIQHKGAKSTRRLKVIQQEDHRSTPDSRHRASTTNVSAAGGNGYAQHITDTQLIAAKRIG